MPISRDRQQRELDKFDGSSPEDTFVKTKDQHTTSDPLPVEDVNKLTITRAIDFLAFDLNASAFNQTTNITSDYILDSLRLNFSTNESKTITVTGPDGTILAGGTDDTTDQNILRNNTDKSLVIPFDLGFDLNQNIQVEITQFSSTGTCDVILNIQQGVTILGSGGSVITNDVTTIDKPYSIQVALNSGDFSLEYVGQAEPGTLTSASSWQIKRVDSTSGTIVLFANGDSSFNQIWDNREALSYS